MSAANLVGLIVTIAAVAFMTYVLIRPEEF